MRSSLFGFIELILLISLILFYRTFACITTQQRKANLGKRRAEPFSAYSVLGEGERNGVERKRSVPVAFSFKLFFAVVGLTDYLLSAIL